MNKLTKYVLATGVLLFSPSVFSQQDTEADPAHHKVEFENNCVRVIRAIFGPGEKAAAPFDAKPAVLVSISGGEGMRLHFPDGNSIVTPPMQAGQVAWSPPGRIQPENISNARIEFIVVEPKGCK